MKFPNLTAPRFKLANRAAQSVLKELGNPEPPIDIERYLAARKWRIQYEELEGPDGYMVKLVKGEKTRYIIFLATDSDPDSQYDEQTVLRRRLFTKAHELGHILLHGRFLLNSHEDMNAIPEDIAGIMEIEAHWFASRLLMPNYLFKNAADLLPDRLSEKCNVNITAAVKRIRSLSPGIRHSLIGFVPPEPVPGPVPESLPEPFAPSEAAAAAEPEATTSKPDAWTLINSPNYQKMFEAKRQSNKSALDALRRIYGFE